MTWFGRKLLSPARENLEEINRQRDLKRRCEESKKLIELAHEVQELVDKRRPK